MDTLYKRRRGLSLLETALSLSITAGALVGFMQLQTDAAARTRAAASAAKLSQVYSAAQDYMKANYGKLYAGIPTGGVVAVPVGKITINGVDPGGPSSIPGLTSIQGGGFLPSTYIDRNSYNQFTSLLVRRVPANGPTAEHLEAMLTTLGGQNIRDVELGQIASKVGAPGGMMFTMPPVGPSGVTVQGAYGGWQTPAAIWAPSGVAPSVGHAMASLTFSQSLVISDYLNRYEVPGMNGEGSRMHTNIDANGHDINNIKNTDTQTITNNATGQVNVNASLVIQNGGIACQGNANGCGWRISDDGGFYDYNDGWVTYVASNTTKGLKVNDNLQVDRDASIGGHAMVGTQTTDNFCLSGGDACGLTVQGGISLRDDWLRISGNGGTFWESYGGGLYMDGATWIKTYGNAGIYAQAGQIITDVAMQSPVYYDRMDNNYQLTPRGTSKLNTVNAEYVGAFGFDGASGYPATWGGGVHTWDVYAEGTVGAGSGGGLAAYMNRNGDIFASNSIGTTGNITSGGDIKATGNLDGNGVNARKYIIVGRDGSGNLIGPNQVILGNGMGSFDSSLSVNNNGNAGIGLSVAHGDIVTNAESNGKGGGLQIAGSAAVKGALTAGNIYGAGVVSLNTSISGQPGGSCNTHIGSDGSVQGSLANSIQGGVVYCDGASWHQMQMQ